MDVLRVRKHQRKAAHRADPTPLDIAIAACRAIVPTHARPQPDLRRAVVLAKFALAMLK